MKYLSNYDCIKVLWEISKIPDYMKSIDYKYSHLLVKLYLNLVRYGKINYDWVMDEIVKLQNIEGSIEELTFRLSKTRFWNYVANKNLWFDNNSNLKEAASNLYAVLRKIKKLKYEGINVVKIPNIGPGIAINDRLKRASQKK